MKKLFAVLATALLALFLIGCAGKAPKRQLSGNVFTSDYPPLQVTLFNPDFKSEEKVYQHGVNQWIYDYGYGEGLNIIVADIGGLDNGGRRYDYYDSLEQIAGHLNFINYDTVYFDDHKWIKYLEVEEGENFLFTGYLTRKDRYLILVFRWNPLRKILHREIEEYKKTHKMTNKLNQLLDEEFKETDILFRIDPDPKNSAAAPKEVAVPQEVPALPKEVTAVRKEGAGTPKEMAVSAEVPPTAFSLRKTPLDRITLNDIDDMISRYGFFGASHQLSGSFKNALVDNKDGTVTDMTTGLMWQRSGSSRTLHIRSARNYIKNLNRYDFAGYADWRIPTMEELASLLKKDKANNLHIDSVFNSQQGRCWSSDKAVTMHGPPDALTVWVLDYHSGKARKSHWYDTNKSGWPDDYILLPDNHVRAVRTIGQ